MLIAYETEDLRDLCLIAAVAEERLGAEPAKSLFAILADIRAADTAIDLFLAEFIEGADNAPPLIRMWIGSSGYILIVSNQVRHNGPSAERVDWSQVRRVRIVEVVANGA